MVMGTVDKHQLRASSVVWELIEPYLTKQAPNLLVILIPQHPQQVCNPYCPLGVSQLVSYDKG